MNLVHALKKKMTKYKIAQKVGATWSTVHLWDRDVWNPSPKYREKLRKLLEGLNGKDKG